MSKNISIFLFHAIPSTSQRQFSIWYFSKWGECGHWHLLCVMRGEVVHVLFAAASTVAATMPQINFELSWAVRRQIKKSRFTRETNSFLKLLIWRDIKVTEQGNSLRAEPWEVRAELRQALRSCSQVCLRAAAWAICCDGEVRVVKVHNVKLVLCIP